MYWFKNLGKRDPEKRYYAVIDEVVVDKDGNPVGISTASAVADEPTNTEVLNLDHIAVPVENEPAPVVAVEKQDEVAAAALPTDEEIETLNTKVDKIIELIDEESTEETSAERTVEELNRKIDTIISILSTKTIIKEVERIIEKETIIKEVPVEVLVDTHDEEPAEEPKPITVAIATDVADNAENIIVDSVDSEAEVDVITAEEVNSQTIELESVSESTEYVPVEVAEDGKPAYVRSRNFAEKMRDADEILQDRYDELKNYALRFRKLKARISRKFDSINQGRFQFVKLSVAGKTLKLYLNMDINTTDPKYHCKDMSDKKTYTTVPVLLRIKSGRAVKYAKRLIDQCAAQHNMLERRKPFEVDSMALVRDFLNDRGLDAGDLDDDNMDYVGDEIAAADDSEE